MPRGCNHRGRAGLGRHFAARALCCALIFGVAAVAPCLADSTVETGEVILGRVEVIDGDTVALTMRGMRVKVRLQGVDAPEFDTRAGRAARTALQRIVGNASLRCVLTGIQSYDREVGVCFGADGRDIGAAIIGAGFALDCPRYSGGRYAALETQAARRRLSPAPYCRG